MTSLTTSQKRWFACLLTASVTGSVILVAVIGGAR
jgi:hypothetical protein